jgi:hypothetical protein
VALAFGGGGARVGMAIASEVLVWFLAFLVGNGEFWGLTLGPWRALLNVDGPWVWN